MNLSTLLMFSVHVPPCYGPNLGCQNRKCYLSDRSAKSGDARCCYMSRSSGKAHSRRGPRYARASLFKVTSQECGLSPYKGILPYKVLIKNKCEFLKMFVDNFTKNWRMFRFIISICYLQ